MARWMAKGVVKGVLARAGGGGGVWVRNGGNDFGLVRRVGGVKAGKEKREEMREKSREMGEKKQMVVLWGLI